LLIVATCVAGWWTIPGGISYGQAFCT